MSYGNCGLIRAGNWKRGKNKIKPVNKGKINEGAYNNCYFDSFTVEWRSRATVAVYEIKSTPCRRLKQ